MSSDDSGFDKEAEREKLRKKYEEDEKDRENTQRMSELLLQGATMTGKHCNECGDPIFRYDGQEFCPTCQYKVGGDQTETADATGNGTGAPAESRETDGERTAADSGTDATVDSDDEPRVEINDVRVADRHADRSDLRNPPSQQGRGSRRDRGDDRATAGQRDSAADHAHRHGHSEQFDSPADGSTDLGAARASLVRTLTDLARRAEGTDDVARARDLLAATREAAEALAALDRANR